MRVYKDKKLTKVVCNNCGKNIKVNNSTIEEGVFFADYKWGYFSKKGWKQKDTFDLCRKCLWNEINRKIFIQNKYKNYTELL